MCIPVDGADARHFLRVADAFGDELLLDLPGEHGRIEALEVGYRVDYIRSGHLGLGAADDARLYRARLVVSSEYLAHAAVRDAQLTRYVARSHALLGQLDNPVPDRVRQWTPVDEHAAQLIDATVTYIFARITYSNI